MNKSDKTPAKPRRTPPRLLQVIRSTRVTPDMQRITLGGEELKGFPANRNGAHIKVFLPRPDQFKPLLPSLGVNGPVWPEAHLRPITRTYSVRRYRQNENELDIDFVLHGYNSPASGWALHAKPGDFLGIAGPGGPDPLISPADWHFIAGDMTALPAISALLEDLPEGSQGHAFIEIKTSRDIQPLVNNTAMSITWLQIESIPARQNDVLLQAVKNVSPPSGVTSVSAFIAGENHAVISIRDYLRTAYGLSKARLYAVPYWRRGQDEETYHQERHRIMDEVY